MGGAYESVGGQRALNVQRGECTTEYSWLILFFFFVLVLFCFVQIPMRLLYLINLSLL